MRSHSRYVIACEERDSLTGIGGDLSFRQEILEILSDWGEVSYDPLSYFRKMAFGDTRSQSDRALQMRLHRMTRRGEISKLKRGGEVFFFLTDKGRSEIAGLDDLSRLET